MTLLPFHPSRILPVLFFLCGVPCARAQAGRQPVRVDHYQIDLALDPAHHLLTAVATVTFTTLSAAPTISFELNPALQISSITDTDGAILQGARVFSDALGAPPNQDSLRITPATPLHKGDAAIWTFTYSGIFDAGAQSTSLNPRLAFLGDPVSYLLYAAHWFPVAGYSTNRFTATMHVHVPVGQLVLGSGSTGPPHQDANGQAVFDFNSTHSGFPGTLIAGRFSEPYAVGAGSNVRLYLIATHPKQKLDAQKYATTALDAYEFLRDRFGPLDSNQLNIVELPDGTAPAYSAPELAAISTAQMQGLAAPRLLANTIAHQWWGERVSPATLADTWVTNGMCRYAEISYLQHSSGEAAMQRAVLDTSAAALAYDTIPVTDAARRSPFSPEFQAMTYDKGMMIFRMLQWQIGDAAFTSTLRDLLLQRSGNSITGEQVEETAETESHQNLQPFFAQWVDSTGAPTLQAKWTLYRLGNNQGFRTMGSIDQDLDLFRMPVEMVIHTEGKTVTQRVEVAGSHSQFVIDSFGLPTSVALDPNHWLLRNSPSMQVRVHILRGQNEAASGDPSHAIQEYQQALAIDDISSLASYRLGDVYFHQHNYQAAADAYRAALRGDEKPRWTEVWSDLQLGKVFDASGQRERARNQYREAIQTGDNTGGALDFARAYLEQPYKPPAEPAPH
jgi:tetratricopeptide (TPR) repeat protein